MILLCEHPVVIGLVPKWENIFSFSKETRQGMRRRAAAQSEKNSATIV
jgi:hypothetical protein